MLPDNTADGRAPQDEERLTDECSVHTSVSDGDCDQLELEPSSSDYIVEVTKRTSATDSNSTDSQDLSPTEDNNSDIERTSVSSLDDSSTGDRVQPTEQDAQEVRELLDRLELNIKQQHDAGLENTDVSVSLKQDDVALIGRLFRAGFLRSTSEGGTDEKFLNRTLTGISLSTIMQRVRGNQTWPVNISFRDLSYTVSVPGADVGIPNVASTMYRFIRPIVDFVTRAEAQRIQLPIIRNISTTFEAGKPILVLGPPGCGVTTLFKLLSARARSSARVKQSGEVYYSGFTSKEVQVGKLTSYIDQVDMHTAVLSVRETLSFAYDCFGGAEAEMKSFRTSRCGTQEDVARLQEYLEKYPDFVISNIGLERAADTVVGNELLRGVSGGERKRVTTAEMMMAQRPVEFYDQISTGLDSATTYDICRRITSIAKNLNHTVAVALLQPPPEVYELFDEILIMALGHIVFHGPREDVLPYFSSIGFDCPFDCDIADFIQEVTTPARTKYQTDPDAPNSEEALAEAWRSSPYSEPKRSVTVYWTNTSNKQDSSMRETHYSSRAPTYANPCTKEFKIVLNRHLKLLFRDPAFFRARVLASLVMGVFLGTMFLNIDPHLPTSFATQSYKPITQRYGVVFSTILQSTLAGLAQIPLVLQYRPVYYKQSGGYFFRTCNYVMSETIATSPTSIIESIILGTLVFWLSGIVPTAKDAITQESDCGVRYIYFILLMIVQNISFSSFLRLIAATAPSAAAAQGCAGISLACTILYSGYIITKSTMPVWFEWIFWLSPLAWAYRSAMMIIFGSTAFTEEQRAFALNFFDLDFDENYIWAGYVILIGFIFLNMSMSMISYQVFRHETTTRQTKLSPDAEDTGNPDVVEVENILQDRASFMCQTQEDSHMGSNLSEPVKTAKLAPTPNEDIAVEITSSSQSFGDSSFAPVDLVFEGLSYSVQGPEDPKGHYNLDLLKDISGFAKAGTMTALMGSSGAGKSTLLDVLALRKTGGKIRGNVFVNGRPQESTSFSRVIGYVEQNDIHSPTATVYEALLFSAMLRQSKSVSSEKKHEFVENIIEMLQLQAIRDFMIGFKQSGGLNTEQAKRLTIGVELAANPAIVFVDEPTSGLDARSARLIVDGLEKIARSGRTVVCTIHQPSKDIFFKFDHLLLLRRGGETVYFGELGAKAKSILEYLQRIPGSPPMPNPRYNPANYMLDVIGAGCSNDGVAVDYAKEYQTSELYGDNKNKIAQLLEDNRLNRPQVVFHSMQASSLQMQLHQLLLRWLRGYWRNSGYNTTRFIIAIFVSCLFGFSFFKM